MSGSFVSFVSLIQCLMCVVLSIVVWIPFPIYLSIYLCENQGVDAVPKRGSFSPL